MVARRIDFVSWILAWNGLRGFAKDGHMVFEMATEGSVYGSRRSGNLLAATDFVGKVRLLCAEGETVQKIATTLCKSVIQ